MTDTICNCKGVVSRAHKRNPHLICIINNILFNIETTCNKHSTLTMQSHTLNVFTVTDNHQTVFHQKLFHTFRLHGTDGKTTKFNLKSSMSTQDFSTGNFSNFSESQLMVTFLSFHRYSNST